VSILCLKIVPDDQPNANGKWLHQAKVPPGFAGAKVFNYVPEPGHHVVKTHRPSSLQDGGPMASAGRYDPCRGDHL